MPPIRSGKFVFDPQSLVDIRMGLGLSQAKMAERLGIPANTLSRWETGATTPDAESLAAIYSLAAESGKPPTFFKRRPPVVKQSKKRSRLLVMWDFQNIGSGYSVVADVDAWIKTEIEQRFPATSYRRFKAFARPDQSNSTDELQELGWRVWEDDADIDPEIVKQSKSDCGQEPNSTVLVLVTKDGDFAELIQGLREKGVEVYLFTSEWGASEQLVKAVGNNHCVIAPVSRSTMW